MNTQRFFSAIRTAPSISPILRSSWLAPFRRLALRSQVIYEYDIKIANAPNPDDEITEVGSLKVFVDPKSSPLLDGIVVDYIDSLLESGFKFTNPNATDTCGCGKSFQAADCGPAGVPCS